MENITTNINPYTEMPRITFEAELAVSNMKVLLVITTKLKCEQQNKVRKEPIFITPLLLTTLYLFVLVLFINYFCTIINREI